MIYLAQFRPALHKKEQRLETSQLERYLDTVEVERFESARAYHILQWLTVNLGQMRVLGKYGVSVCPNFGCSQVRPYGSRCNPPVDSLGFVIKIS